MRIFVVDELDALTPGCCWYERLPVVLLDSALYMFPCPSLLTYFFCGLLVFCHITLGSCLPSCICSHSELSISVYFHNSNHHLFMDSVENFTCIVNEM